MATSLSGTTSVNGRVVRVHRADNGLLVGETVSSPSTGAWAIDTTGVPGKCYAIEHNCDDIGTLGMIQTSRMNSANSSTTFTEYFGNALTTVGNTVSSNTNPPSLTGISTSAYFDGSGDEVTLTNFAGFTPGYGDFCIEVFARPDAVSGDNYRNVFYIAHAAGNLIMRYGNSGFGYKLQVSVLNTAISNVWSCNKTQSSEASAWGLYCFERYKGVCRIYYNGNVQSINSGANPVTYPYTSFTDRTVVETITAASLGVTNWKGNIGPWRILNKALYKGSNYTVPTGPWPESFGSGDVNALILDYLTPG